MFTPEDEVDEIHRELGRWRRRLHDAETSAGEWRQCSYVEVRKTIARCDFHIARLERALAEELARFDAQDEAYEMDAA
jgi:hypothetical protein